MERSPRAFLSRSFFVGCAAVSTAVAQAGAEPDYVPVDDLTQSAQVVEPYLTKLPHRGGRVIAGEENWLLRGSGPGSAAGGRETTIRDEQRDGWFGPGHLEAVLTDLSPELAGKFGLLEGGSLLRVPVGLTALSRALVSELRSNLPPRMHLDLELRIGDEVLLGRSTDFWSGRLDWVSAVAESAAISDYEVEIAQSSFTGNPISGPSDSGAMVVLRPWVGSAEVTGWCEVLVRVIDRGNEPAFDSGNTSCGTLDRVHQITHEFAAVVPIKLGAPMVQRWTGTDGRPVELKIVPSWQVQAPTPVGGRDVHYQPCWSTAHGFRCTGGVWPNPEFDEAPRPVASFAEAMDATGAGGRPVGPGETARFAIDAEASAVRAATRARLSTMHPTAVRIELFDAPVGAKPDEAGVVADAKPLGAAEVTTARDTWACMTAHEELTVVLDWDTEVAQSSRIADPKPTRLAYGLFLDLRCRDQEIEVVGEISTRLALEGRTTRLSTALLSQATNGGSSGGSGGASEHPVVLPGESVRIDVPRVLRQPLHATLPLRRAEPSIWRARSALLPAGRELLLLVRRAD